MSHAILSASGASRWMACTPSARLEDQMPNVSSSYADEGTKAHDLGEKMLRYELGDPEYLLAPRKEDWPSDMWHHMENYRDYVLERYAEAKARTADASIEIEFKIETDRWIPEGFGRNDAAIISDDILDIIDYKHGMGVPVYAQDNPQLKIYALGALVKLGFLYDIRKVRVHIYQPRIDNISVAEYSVEELYDWAEYELKPKALEAWEGKGEFVVGSHCRFCRVKATCRAFAEHNMELTKHEFAGPALLTDEEIPEILKAAELLGIWVNAVQEYALEQAKNGKEWVGYKLVEGRSNRKFTDEDAVAKLLAKKGFKKAETHVTKLMTLTGLEGLLGKKDFAEILGAYVIKPEGAPTLVPESDKRPAMQMFSELPELIS